MRTGDLGGRPIIKPSMELVMVGATGIEPVTPSMSIGQNGVSARWTAVPQESFKAHSTRLSCIPIKYRRSLSFR